MDKNEIFESLNELSGRVIAMGQHISTQDNAHDLELLVRSLHRSADELMSIVNVMIDQQL